MISLSQYLLESSICLAIFYGFYHFFLRRETFFQLNRFYLLCSPALALLIPLLNISLQPTTEYLYPIVTQTASWNQRLWQTMELQPTPLLTITVGDLLLIIYALGGFVMAQRLFHSLWRVGQLIRKNRRVAAEEFTVVETNNDLPAASFFSFVFWKGGRLSEQQRLILEHELVHVRQKHSVDVLLMEFWVILKWFNPLIYLFRRSLRVTHEYIADHYVTRQSGSKSNYARLLVRLGQPNGRLSLVNTFSLLTKKRLLMLSQKPSPNWRYAKYILSLPLLVTLMLLFSFNLTDNLPQGVKAPFQKAATALDDFSQKELLTIEDFNHEAATCCPEDFFDNTPILPDSTKVILNGKPIAEFNEVVSIFEEDILSMDVRKNLDGEQSPGYILLTTKNQYLGVQPIVLNWGELQLKVPEPVQLLANGKLQVFKKTQRHTVSQAQLKAALQQQPQAIFPNGQALSKLDYDLMHIPKNGTPQPQWVSQPDAQHLRKLSANLQTGDVLELRKFFPENIGIYVFLEARNDTDIAVQENVQKVLQNKQLPERATELRLTPKAFQEQFNQSVAVFEKDGQRKAIEKLYSLIYWKSDSKQENVQFLNEGIDYRTAQLHYEHWFEQAKVGDKYIFGLGDEGMLEVRIVGKAEQSSNIIFRLTKAPFVNKFLSDKIIVEINGDLKSIAEIEAVVKYTQDYAKVSFPLKSKVGGFDKDYADFIRSAQVGDTYHFRGVRIEGEQRTGDIAVRIVGEKVDESSDNLPNIRTSEHLSRIPVINTPGQDESLSNSLNQSTNPNAESEQEATQRIVTGTILNEQDQPLIGANVLMTGTKMGTITDVKGRFELEVPKEYSELTISYVGYRTVTTSIDGMKQAMLIVMQKAEEGEEEQETIFRSQDGPTELRITSKSKSGENQDILYVIDGEIVPEGAINQMDPNTIESITVIKDQEKAIARYGEEARGKDGVIEIITKNAPKDERQGYIMTIVDREKFLANATFDGEFKDQELLERKSIKNAKNRAVSNMNGVRQFLENAFGIEIIDETGLAVDMNVVIGYDRKSLQRSIQYLEKHFGLLLLQVQ